jgi:hypothetical protein
MDSFIDFSHLTDYFDPLTCIHYDNYFDHNFNDQQYFKSNDDHDFVMIEQINNRCDHSNYSSSFSVNISILSNRSDEQQLANILIQFFN